MEQSQTLEAGYIAVQGRGRETLSLCMLSCFVPQGLPFSSLSGVSQGTLMRNPESQNTRLTPTVLAGARGHSEYLSYCPPGHKPALGLEPCGHVPGQLWVRPTEEEFLQGDQSPHSHQMLQMSLEVTSLLLGLFIRTATCAFP